MVTVPLRAGAHVLGVRVNSGELAELLRARFGPRHVSGSDPPANLSVFLAPRSREGDAAQRLHRLYLAHHRLVRTASVSQVLHALWHELDGRDAVAARRAPMLLATVVVREGRAHVLPPSLRPGVVDAQRRWRRHGFQLVDRRLVELDHRAGAIVLPPSGLVLGEGDAARLRATGSHHREEPRQPVGRFPIEGFVNLPGSDSLAGRVVEAAGLVVDRPAHDGPAIIRWLAAFLGEQPAVAGASAQEVLRQLTRRATQ